MELHIVTILAKNNGMKKNMAIFVIFCNYFILFNCNNAIVAKPQSLENKNTAKTAIILSKRNICANKYVHMIVHMNYVHFNDIVNSIRFSSITSFCILCG